MKSYDFIGIDEGCQTIFRADSGSGKLTWKKSLDDYPNARALQSLGEGHILSGYDGGYMIIRSSDGEVIHDCRRWQGITGAFSSDDGTTLLAGLDLEGCEGITVITLDKDDKVVKKSSRPGDYVRLITLAGSDRFLLSTNDRITETDEELNTIRTMGAEGFLHAWQSQRLNDGRTLVSAGYGAFMAYFDSDGNIEKTFGRKEELPPEIEPFFYASFRFAPDGSLLVANWEGHGPDNGNKGRQLLRFNADGEYLESVSFPEEISSLQGLLVL